MDTGLSALLRAFEAERQQWYSQQRALLDRVTALEGLASQSLDPLADELALAKIANYHLREKLLLLEQEIESLRQSVFALWDFVTPDRPPVLSVAAVTALERHCRDSSDPVRVSVSGFNLFCAFSSSRWSDAARANRIILDKSTSGVTLLEAETMHYKTRAKDRKNKVLPLIALGSGLTQPEWAISWMKAREHLGMDKLPFLMPGLSVSNNFLPRAMSAAEGTLWLRELLHEQGVNEDLERYSSHSLKATCLSWTAKSATMTYEERLTQGHHVSPKHGMALLYSRDALTEILIKVSRVVRAVASSSFNPDLPRAERIAAALADDPAKYKHLPETAPEEVALQEPEMENISEAGSDLSDHEELMGPDALPLPHDLKPRADRPLKGPAWIHILSGVSHVEAAQGHLKCGRKITVNTTDFEPQNVICQQCAASQ